MYIVFIILLQNYEKATDGQSYRLFWKGLGFNFLKAPGLKKLGFPGEWYSVLLKVQGTSVCLAM